MRGIREHFRRYAHALRFAIGLHGVIPPQITQKSAKLNGSDPDFDENAYIWSL